VTKLGHNRAVSRTTVGDRWRVTLKRTVKRRIVVMLTLDDSKQLQAVIVLLSSSLSSKCTKTCAYGIIYCVYQTHLLYGARKRVICAFGFLFIEIV